MVDDVRAESARRPEQIVGGRRPRLAIPRVDRDELIRLEEALSAGGLAPVCALHGIPGIGKSQLASACAERCESRGWAFVGWVAAPTRQQAIAELAMIARIAGLVPDDGPLDDAASRLVSWLSEGIRADRLLVFDNVENADDLEGLVPRGQGMRVIVTTTAQVAATWLPLEVGRLSTPQAVALLTGMTGVADEAEAAALADDLDRLPAALAQAASTISLLRLGWAEYRTLLAASPVERGEGDSSPANVERALRMAYRSYLSRLADSDPEQAAIARRVLGALSLAAESGTPTSWLHVLGGDPAAVERTVGGLIHHCLVIPDADGRRLALHRLHARVIREDPETGAEAHRAAVAVLGALGAGSGVTTGHNGRFSASRWWPWRRYWASTTPGR